MGITIPIWKAVETQTFSTYKCQIDNIILKFQLLNGLLQTGSFNS